MRPTCGTRGRSWSRLRSTPTSRSTGRPTCARRSFRSGRRPMHTILQPEGWAKPVGYANGVAARGRLVFVGGQIGWNSQQKFETDELVGQVRQTLQNVVDVLAAA